MNNKVLSYIIRFVVLVLIQVLILNNIQLGGFINPYLYIIFILLLPADLPGWVTLVLGFAIGLAIDIFCYTPGIHAFSTVLISYLRIKILNIISPRGDYNAGVEPSIAEFGWVWFFKYSIPLIVIHHFSLFLLEAYSLKYFWILLAKTLLSSIFTLLLIVIAQSYYKRLDIG